MNTPSSASILGKLSRLLLGLATLFLTACGPEEYLHWSPDGRHALVKGGDGHYLVDATGRILHKLPLNEAWLDQPWLPDSRRILAVRAVPARNLEELAALLGPTRTAGLSRVAEDLLVALQNYEGKLDDFPFADFGPRVGEYAACYESALGSRALELCFFFLAQKHPVAAVALAKKFSAQDPLKAEKEEEFPLIYELIIRSVHPEAGNTTQVLVRSADEILWARASRNGQAVAFIQQEGVRPALRVIPVSGNREPILVDTGATNAAWTSDGLVYAKTNLPFRFLETDMHLGTVTRRKVCDPAGQLLTPLEDPRDLAGILFTPSTQVAALADDRILFATATLELPASPEQSPTVTLFCLPPGEGASISRVISLPTSPAQPVRLERFSVSPDSQHLAFSSGSPGEVAVLALASGQVRLLQEAVPSWNSDNQNQLENRAPSPVPTWRNAQELCYVVPAGQRGTSARRAEVVLHPLSGTPRVISASWSDAMTQNFLPRPKPAGK